MVVVVVVVSSSYFPPFYNEIICVMEARCVSCDVGSELLISLDRFLVSES